MTHKSYSSAAIRNVALLTMTIDHIGVFVLGKLSRGTPALYVLVQNIETIFRIIGRLAFPLFCFLLVQSYLHTSSKTKYLLRMSIFAVATQPLYNYIHGLPLFQLENLNIFITLAIGFAILWVLDTIRLKQEVLFWICLCAVPFLFTWLVTIIPLQYGAYGICLICGIYVLWKQKTLLFVFLIVLHLYFYNKYFGVSPDLYLNQQLLAQCPSWQQVLTRFIMTLRLNIQWFAIGAFWWMSHYNHEKGTSKLPRLFYYFYYPVHLVLLYFLGLAL